MPGTSGVNFAQRGRGELEEDSWKNKVFTLKRWRRFRHWERTQFRRFGAGGGDIVEGRRQCQLPPSCQPGACLRGLTRVYSRGVQPGSWSLPDSRPALWAPEKGGGRAQARAQPRRSPPASQRLQDSGGTEPPACAPGPAYKLASKGSLWVFLFLLSLGRDKDKLAKDRVPGEEVEEEEGPARRRRLSTRAV